MPMLLHMKHLKGESSLLSAFTAAFPKNTIMSILTPIQMKTLINKKVLKGDLNGKEKKLVEHLGFCFDEGQYLFNGKSKLILSNPDKVRNVHAASGLGPVFSVEYFEVRYGCRVPPVVTAFPNAFVNLGSQTGDFHGGANLGHSVPGRHLRRVLVFSVLLVLHLKYHRNVYRYPIIQDLLGQISNLQLLGAPGAIKSDLLKTLANMTGFTGMIMLGSSTESAIRTRMASVLC